MESNELDTLITVRNTLSNIPINRQSVEYMNICFEIDAILYKRCEHKILFDTIDIDIEHSKHIWYCDKCFLTFNVEFFRDFLLFTLDEKKRDQWKVITNKGIFDIYDIYVLNNQLCFQICCYHDFNECHKYNLQEILNCRADDSIVYINN